MPAPDNCQITGVLLDINEQAWPNQVVRAKPYDGAFFRNEGSSWQIVEYGERVSITDSNGNWSFNLPWASECDPTSMKWLIETPTAKWAGVVPSITGPITIKSLKDSYSWAMPADGQKTPIQTVQGPLGLNWRNPTNWANNITYEPLDAVTYQQSSWRALAENFNSPPSLSNSNWALIALGGTGGSTWAYDASTYGADFGVAIAAIVTALSGTAGNVIVASSMPCAANCVVPTNITLQFVNTGQIVVNSGVTVTILGGILDCGSKQIFSALGTNTGSAGTGSIALAYRDWNSATTYNAGDRVINSGILWEATGTSTGSTPRVNTINTNAAIGTQSVNFSGTVLSGSTNVQIEFGSGNTETVTTSTSPAPTYDATTATGTFTATFTKTHTAPYEAINPNWKRAGSGAFQEISNTSVIRPEWWGAKSDSDLGQVNTDCAPAFNAMTAALPGRGGVEVRCSGGIYAFKSTWAIHSFSSPNQKQDFIVTGNYSKIAQGSVGATTFMWAGGTTFPTIDSIIAGTPIALTSMVEDYSREVLFRGIYFTVANGYICDCLVDIDWATPTTSGGATSHAQAFDNCAWGFPLQYIAGISGKPYIGIRIGAKNLTNSEYHSFIGCVMDHCVTTVPMRGWWQQQLTYNKGDIVWWAGEAYVSIVNGNLNHKPDVGLDITLTPVRSSNWMVADPSIIGGAAMFIPNTTGQVKRILVKDTQMNGNVNNNAVFNTQQWGIYMYSGSLQVLSCELFHMPQNIRVQTPNDFIIIDGTDSELSQQMYRADNTGGFAATTIANGRFSLAQVDTTTPVGGEYIHCNSGPTIIDSVVFNPGQGTLVNPAMFIYTPSTSALTLRNMFMPNWAFVTTDVVDAPIIIENCKVTQGTGNLNRVLPRMVTHGAVASANSATGSSVGSGVFSGPMDINLFPSNVTPKILRPLSPNIHPMNCQIFKGTSRSSGVASGVHNYLWTRWNSGVEHPVGAALTINPTFLDGNSQPTQGEIWIAPPPVAKPTDQKFSLYRNDPSVNGTYYFLTDVTVGTQSVTDLVNVVGPSTPYTTPMPSFGSSLDPGVYDWAITACTASGGETDPSDRFTQQFTAVFDPVVMVPWPTQGTDHINVYRTKVFPGGTSAPTATLTSGSGMEDGKRVYCVACVYDPITITNITGGGTSIVNGNTYSVDYTGSFVPQIGQKVLVDFMTAVQEYVTVTDNNGGAGGHFTAKFNKTHTAGSSLFACSNMTHISTPSSVVDCEASPSNLSRVTITNCPTTPSGTWRVIGRTKSGGQAFTSTFFPITLIQNNNGSVNYLDSSTDASYTALQAITPTLLKLPISQNVKDYGNYLYATMDDTTVDSALLTTNTQPSALGTNTASIEAFRVLDGGARIGGDLTLTGGQFAGQGSLRLLGPTSGTPAVAPAGTCAFYYDNVGNRIRVSYNGGSWSDLLATTQTDVIYSGLLQSTGTDKVNIVLPGGSGVVATASVSGGAVQSVSVSNGGDGFAGGAPTVVFVPQGGDQPSTVATATATVTDASISSVTVNSGGAGYNNPPLVAFFTAATQAGGAGLSIALGDCNNQRGRFTLSPSNGVLSVTVSNGGTGYVQSAPVTFTRHGTDVTGTGASGYINVSGGVITSVTMTNYGNSYTQVPDLSVPTGTGAVLTAVLSATSAAAVARIMVQGHTKIPGYAGAVFYGAPSGGSSNIDLALKNAQLTSGSDKVLLDLVVGTALTVGNTYNIGYFILP